MHRIIVKIGCPHCGFPAVASLEYNCQEFLLYKCPNCHSNVVYYNNKLDTISDQMLQKLIDKDKLKTCGLLDVASPNIPPVKDQPISTDDLIDLNIALESTTSVDDFIKKLK